MLKKIFPIVVGGLVLLSLGLPAARPALAAPSVVFTVNSTLDKVDNNPGDGQCLTDSGTCTLRAAVMEADKSSGAGATIMLSTNLYSLTIPADLTDAANTGDLNLTTPASGTPLISIQGAGAGSTIIDANGLDRVLSVAGGRTASLSGLTLRGGFVNGDFGGGVDNQGTLTLDHVTVSGNQVTGRDGGGLENLSVMTVTQSTIGPDNVADDCGGICNDGTLLFLDRSTITGNHANTSGGGIYNNTNASLVMINSALSHNTASANGGGLVNSGTANVSNTAIVSNTANSGSTGAFFGGGVYNDHALTLDHATVSGNQVIGGDGGGLENLAVMTVTQSTIGPDNVAMYCGGICNDGTLFVDRSTIEGNHANTSGGGIYNNGLRNLVMIDSTLSHNTADANGGGLFNLGTANVYNLTIVFNGADTGSTGAFFGGGVYASGGSFAQRNTLLAGNSVGSGTPDDCSGTLHLYGNNLFGEASPCLLSQADGGTAGVLNSVALVGPLANNGGPTPTHALLAGSNAIDGGDPVFGCTDEFGLPIATDQRGLARVLGARCDIGALEALPPAAYLPYIGR